MRRLCFLVCSFYLLSLSSVFASSEPTVDEWWQEFYLYHSFSEKWTVGLLLNNFYISEVGNKDWFAEGVLKYKISNRIGAEVMYRQEYFEDGGSWTYEKRPMFRVSGETKIGNLFIRNRQRIEYRIFEFDKDHFRYRTDIRIKPDWKISSWHLTPYLQEEFFVRLEKLSRIRSYIGVQGKIKKLEPAAYVLVQSKKNSVKEFTHKVILGIYLGIEI